MTDQYATPTEAARWAAIHETVALQQALERKRGLETNWRDAIVHLIKAKDDLDRTPRAWQNDCVYDSIKKIDEIIASLRGGT
jgi:hypothetical protein